MAGSDRAAAVGEELLVGTSGWQYRSWREPVYGGTPPSCWLEQYAEQFPVVEVNSSFYRLPERRTCVAWAAATPDDFVFVLKVSRYLSHVRRLRDPGEPVDRFFERASGLGAKLGGALLQLPPDFACDVGRLAGVLDRWPREVPLAVEFRHPSWFDDEVHALLSERGVATCRTDRHGRPQEPPWVTAPWCYVRFHEGRARPVPCYGRVALAHWVRRLHQGWGGGAGGFVFFNNDPQACAPADATTFARLAERSGLPVRRATVGAP